MTTVALRPQEPGYSAEGSLDDRLRATNAVPKLYAMLDGKDHESPPTTGERSESEDAPQPEAPEPAKSAPTPALPPPQATPMTALERHLAGPRAYVRRPVDNNSNTGDATPMPDASTDLVVVEKSIPAAPAVPGAYDLAAGIGTVERTADDAVKGSPTSAERFKHSRDVCGLGCGINNQGIREAGLCAIS